MAELTPSWNPYNYVQNTPINAIDPDGRACLGCGPNGENFTPPERDGVPMFIGSNANGFWPPENGNAGHQILGGGLGGGIGSAISGGNFWQGFGQRLAVRAFNHALQNGIVQRIRNQIAANAKAEVGSTEWNFDVEKDNFGKNTNKCNKFVHDMVTESGVDLPTPNGGMFGPNEYPINAGQWADPNYEIPGWMIVKSPKNGDVISMKLEGSGFTGHTGIVVTSRGYRNTVSANGNAIVLNNWGFRSEQANKIVIRRYIGKGSW